MSGSLDTIPGFVAAGTDVSSAQPRIIIIFGWMSARAGHLQKYTDYYKTVYPNACIIVARSWPSLFWSSTRTRERYLEPLVRVLDQQGVFSESSPSVLMHVFSNGGSYLTTELSRMISARHLGVQKEKPTTCLVFDSCPGTGSIWIGVRAFTATVRSRIAKFLTGVLFFLAILVLIAMRTLSGQPHLINDMRSRLNNPSLFPWTSEATPRLYIYSDTDTMVPEEFVEEHIAAARQRGLNVRAELYHGSPHVSHARQDPEKYWGAIQTLWAEAVKLSNQDE